MSENLPDIVSREIRKRILIEQLPKEFRTPLVQLIELICEERLDARMSKHDTKLQNELGQLFELVQENHQRMASRNTAMHA